MRKRKDKNHKDVVGFYLDEGCTVHDTADVGGGFPDIVVGTEGYTIVVEQSKAALALLNMQLALLGIDYKIYSGANLLVEIKNGNWQLTEDQEDWHEVWNGQKVIVETKEDVKKSLKNTK